MLRPADCPGPQPSGAARLVDQGNRVAPEERRHDRLHLVRVADVPAGRRFIERDPQAHISCGGYRRDAPNELANRAGQCIGAMVSPDERHRDRAVLGNRDDGRFVLFGGEEGGNRTNQDAAGADADDRPTRVEQRANMGRHAVVALVPVAGMGARPVQPSAGQRRPQSPAECGAPGAEHDHGNVLG